MTFTNVDVDVPSEEQAATPPPVPPHTTPTLMCHVSMLDMDAGAG